MSPGYHFLNDLASVSNTAMEWVQLANVPQVAFCFCDACGLRREAAPGQHAHMGLGAEGAKPHYARPSLRVRTAAVDCSPQHRVSHPPFYTIHRHGKLEQARNPIGRKRRAPVSCQPRYQFRTRVSRYPSSWLGPPATSNPLSIRYLWRL